MDYSKLSPAQMRECIRNGSWQRPTAGLAPGFAQANLVALPKEAAFDFLLFCQRNPKPCPVLDVTDAGNPEPKIAAPGADLRTDIPKYRIYKRGVLTDEVNNLSGYWRDDLVAFLLGCSFSFESSLLRADIPVRHIEENCNVPMYITGIECRSAGIFKGPLVVSMRPLPADKIVKAVQVTSRFPTVHGAPVHIGDPSAIGIKDLGKPDFGDAVTVNPGETPVFWACGCTPQAVAMAAKPEFMITHAPGHMFITDIKDESIATL